MKLRFFFALATLALLPACIKTLDTRSQVGELPAHADLVIKEKVSLDYLAYVPADAAHQPFRKWPAIIFLHGSGERGTNVWEVAKHGPPKIAKEKTDFPFIVLAPQCPPGEQWQPDAVAAFVKLMQRKYPVDPDRIYLTGLSMGGSGTWNTLLKYPDLFAAAVPICGRADTNGLPYLPAEKRAAIKQVPIWVFHGAKDPEVAVKYSQQMTGALEKLGADIKLTIYPEALHDSWTQTYANAELYAWLLSHNRKDHAVKANSP